jgi:Tfp pilus assembly protein PilN
MIRINLAPATVRRRGPAFRLRLPSVGLGLVFGVLYVLLVVGVGGYWWTLSGHEARLADDIAQKTKELTALKATIGQESKVKDQLADLKKRVQVLEDLTKGRERFIKLIDAFAEMVPRDLWIAKLEENGVVLRLTGSAFAASAVSDLMANLRSSGKFKDVDLVVSRQDFSKTPSPVTFEVICRFEG